MVKTRLKLFLGIFIPILSFFLMSQNTFADWVQQSSIYFDSRTYGINEGSGWNMTTDTNFGMRSLPVTILNTMNGQGRRLLNFTVYQPITDNTNNRFKSIQMDITVQQDTSFNYDSINDVGGGITVITSNGNVYGTCGISASGRNYKQFRCQANMPEYTNVSGVYMRVGEAVTANDIPIASIASSSTNNAVPFQPIKVTYVAYDFKSSPDPSLGLLQQQINQNQTIINQNQTTINQNQQMLDNWDDEKSENQQQGQNSENASSDTQAQTTQNTQNLMDFITAFFTAFVSASATNCNLDIGLSQYGFGNIDMCSTEIPAVFSVIINIITLVMVVPMVFWLISSIISAFKEFQE